MDVAAPSASPSPIKPPKTPRKNNVRNSFIAPPPPAADDSDDDADDDAEWGMLKWQSAFFFRQTSGYIDTSIGAVKEDPIDKSGSDSDHAEGLEYKSDQDTSPDEDGDDDMPQRGLLKKKSEAPPPRPKSVSDVSGPSEIKWGASKANKYGMKQPRVFSVDHTTRSMKVYSAKGVLKSEVPVMQIENCVKTKEKVMLNFAERSRVYAVHFQSEADAADFVTHFGAAKAAANQVGRLRAPTAMGGGSVTPVASVSEGTTATMEGEFVEEGDQKEKSYLDYKVVKKNKFGQSQKRCLVLKQRESIEILNDQRKFIKSIQLDHILFIEVTGKAEVYVVFRKEIGQRTFHIFFKDEFEMKHFIEHVKVNVEVKETGQKAKGEVSFSVTKVTMRGTKKRIVVILEEQQVLRSFDQAKAFEDCHFREVMNVTSSALSRKDCYVMVKGQPVQNLRFPDIAACYKFIACCHQVMDKLNNTNVLDEEDPDMDCILAANSNALFDSRLPSKPLKSKTSAPTPLSKTSLDLFCLTWNLGNFAADEDKFSTFLPPAQDIYVIGFQECNSKTRDGVLQSLLNGLGFGYDIVRSHRLWDIVLVILIRIELASKVSNVEMATVATGIGDVLGNKGGVGISFRYEDTSLCFVVSHLAARFERVQQRRENYFKIVRGLRLGNAIDCLSQFDHTIWLGDLNYRTQLGFAETCALVEKRDFAAIAAADQLKQEMSKENRAERPFPDFKEGELNFCPTYRWERDENTISNKKEQSPSFTDRVLWHSNPGTGLLLDWYQSAQHITGSDHRPVLARFTLTPRQFKWKPHYGVNRQAPLVLNIQLLVCLDNTQGVVVPVVSSACMAEELTLSKKDGYTEWKGVEILPFICDPQALKEHYLVFSIMKSSGRRLPGGGSGRVSVSADGDRASQNRDTVNTESSDTHGIATVSLQNLVEDQEFAFTSNLKLAGMAVGVLRGHIRMTFPKGRPGDVT